MSRRVEGTGFWQKRNGRGDVWPESKVNLSGFIQPQRAIALCPFGAEDRVTLGRKPGPRWGGSPGHVGAEARAPFGRMTSASR